MSPAYGDVASSITLHQSINQYIYNAPWYRGACYSADYAKTKRSVLSRILNVLTDGAVRQFRGREFQSLGAATEKRRAVTFLRWPELIAARTTVARTGTNKLHNNVRMTVEINVFSAFAENTVNDEADIM